MKAWKDFNGITWKETINVRDFIINNYTPYEGDDSFLESKTQRTTDLWNEVDELITSEIQNQTVSVDTSTFSGISNYGAGYIDESNEVIVGLQTDEPLKRIMNPYGGLRMVDQSLKAYDIDIDESMISRFSEYRKTHNDGVFDAYTKEMRSVRTAGLLTGLPDAYGRGRIIGDYRRVALYGIDFLIEQKLIDKENIVGDATEDIIRAREEISEQIKALKEMILMAKEYGYDISQPASNSKEAVQWLYFGYLAAIKENNGAAMSLGRNTHFLDIYIERDLKNKVITEAEAQELIDQFVIKLRLVRHLRTPEYDNLFAGDPTWVTESIGGMGSDGRTMVTKTAYRFLHTLTNLSPAPEPNMTVLWSQDLPKNFKDFVSKLSIQTGSIQYENDDLMRSIYGDDYGIACCVSAMDIGKEMQFFGARANLAKALLYAINGGKDELKLTDDGSHLQVLDNIEPITSEVLSYDEVTKNFDAVLKKLSNIYVNTMNTIHYMHDKYAYEAGQMALHDSNIHRYMAFGIAGISIVADSLSAIKYAEVKPIRNSEGIAIDFEIHGDYPKYGNDDDRVDTLAVDLVNKFQNYLEDTPTYRNAEHTLSVLTITSNVVYGKKTGATPDGRKVGEPFAPGANPMHGRDTSGALASLNSVAKLPYCDSCKDGISNTFSIIPETLGTNEQMRIENLTNILDGYFKQDAFHINVNVLKRELLLDAMENPAKYPNLTIRVSGYAVHFNRLSKEQQEEVLKRTFHSHI